MKAYDKKCAGCRWDLWPIGLCLHPRGHILQAEGRKLEQPCGPEAKLFEAKEGAATMDSVFLSEKWD